MKTEKLGIGIDGLDSILGGGIVKGNSVLVEGPPGSGKTTLGMQFVYNGIVKYGQPGLIISFEQFPQDLYRDAFSFGWDLKKLEKEEKLRVICTSPQTFKDSLADSNGFLREIIRDLDVKRIHLDSITHFRRITENEIELRELLYKLLNGFKGLGLTAILVKEIAEAETLQVSFEEYVADTAIRLYNTSLSSVGENKRLIEIRKTRGQGHISGKHPFAFRSEGIEVYPHLKPEPRKLCYETSDEQVEETKRIKSGVDSLDSMLGGGFIKGTSTLVVGSAGLGKTLLGMHFVAEGIKNNEPAVYISFEEEPQRLIQYSEKFGFNLNQMKNNNLLKFMPVLPIDLCMEELIYNLKKTIDETKAKRVVIDSVSDLSSSVSNTNLLRDYVYTIIKILEGKEITSLLTYEMEQITGEVKLTDIGYSFIVDSVIFLGYVEVQSEMKKVISVLKMRGSNHDKELKNYEITSEGVEIYTKFAGLAGVLSGLPTGKWRETIEEIIQPLTFIRDFTEILMGEDVDRKKQAKILLNIKEQVDNVTYQLCKEYGMDFNRITGISDKLG